jgi:hypothetical protein
MSKLFKFMGWAMIAVTALQFFPQPTDSFNPVLSATMSGVLALASFLVAKAVREE